MLEVQDVTKRYDGRAVVNRVSFRVEAGEIFALLGPNGAGKTTLIRMITDIIRPDEGTVTIDGSPTGGEQRHNISYLPEERGLYKRARVVDAVALYGELKGMTAAAARSAALALLRTMELEEWATKQVQALSKGMQQKVQICTALISGPKMIILDEPFTGLDPVNTQLLEDILAERRRQGTTVLLSTHQISKVEELCDRALMIHHGHMVLYGSVRDIRRSYSENAVVVRTEADLAAAPGVARVQRIDGQQRVYVADGGSPPALMAWLGERGVEVESFARDAMPLEDIFVKVVREGIGMDRGQSAKEEVAPAAAASPAPVGAR